jgi:SAM-dependent methyltransferase
VSTAGGADQRHVDAYFDAAAGYWSGIYASTDLVGRVYRRRMQLTMSWVRALGLPADAPVLDLGCGAGLMTVRLAADGLRVTAVDSSPEMVQATARHVRERGLQDRVDVHRSDVHELADADGTFRLVVALGVLPWLHDPAGAVIELHRVVAPGGWVILTADNRRRLNRVVEPRENPLLRPLRPVKRRLFGPPAAPPLSHRHHPAEVDALLARAGFHVARRATVGYGPFTVLDRRVIPDRWGVALDDRLQRAAADHPRLRAVGWHYVVAATRPPGA